jgi:hypothetical protein
MTIPYFAFVEQTPSLTETGAARVSTTQRYGSESTSYDATTRRPVTAIAKFFTDMNVAAPRISDVYAIGRATDAVARKHCTNPQYRMPALATELRAFAWRN